MQAFLQCRAVLADLGDEVARLRNHAVPLQLDDDVLARRGPVADVDPPGSLLVGELGVELREFLHDSLLDALVRRRALPRGVE